ncbi:hypothetical protein NRIC_29340 [Enterococcus florum]|uniref:Competence protein ComG n=1 Tax=Enterococcus florum TaxID=2480627 RepID=A0A4P5PPM7_9ENTE|nr:hypothetical protein NRIC_29340 [Enterococcus florum]
MSVLLLVFIFSFLLLNLLFTYQQAADFARRTEQLYQAKIAKELFLAEGVPVETTGEWQFNLGIVEYKKNDSTIVINVTIDRQRYTFTENQGE